MSFSCPHLVDNQCNIKKTDCKPGVGKCVLKGKIITLSDLIDQPVKNDNPETPDNT